MQISTAMKSNTHIMDMMRFAESINQRFIKHFYPEAVDMLVTVKIVKDKAFYLFDWICSELRQKNELYTFENTDLTNWMLTLLSRLQRTFYNLQRIDLLISNC